MARGTESYLILSVGDFHLVLFILVHGKYSFMYHLILSVGDFQVPSVIGPLGSIPNSAKDVSTATDVGITTHLGIA